jgi:shikimate dehydrogenase
MPLKRDILPLLDERDQLVTLTGGANTVLFDNGLTRGFNTDVYGIVRAFQDAGVERLQSPIIFGSGATAASAMVAIVQLGAKQATVVAREPRKAASLVALGTSLGVKVELQGQAGGMLFWAPDAVISTVPGHSHSRLQFPDDAMAASVLLDVAYDPWPSTSATAWTKAGGTVVSGLQMLLHQALAQVRIFVGGDPAIELDNEPAVLDAMRASLER